MARKQLVAAEFCVGEGSAEGLEPTMIASYIGDLLCELEKMAGANGMRALAEALQLARIEALGVVSKNDN